MRWLALAGSVMVAAGMALGSEGAALIGASSAARGERPPRTGCGKVPRGQALQPKRGRDLILGPVAFYKAVRRNDELIADSDAFEREPGKRRPGLKAPAILKRGTVATVVVPRSERPKLKIDFSFDHRASYKSRLEACDDKRTGFPGGFSVRGPLCTKLRVRVAGRKRPITEPVSFGAGECPPGQRSRAAVG